MSSFSHNVWTENKLLIKDQDQVKKETGRVIMKQNMYIRHTWSSIRFVKLLLPCRDGELPGAEQREEVQQRAGPGSAGLAQDGRGRRPVRSRQVHPHPRHLESPEEGGFCLHSGGIIPFFEGVFNFKLFDVDSRQKF